MRSIFTIVISSLVLFASPSLFADPPAPRLNDVIECYDGLKLSLGLKQMHFGRGPAIFAAGTRERAQGVYTYEAGKLFFHTLPTTNSVDDVTAYGRSIERYDSGRKMNYYLTFESGGAKAYVVLGKSAARPLFWRGGGEWNRFIDSPGGIELPGPGGVRFTVRVPIHVSPKAKVEVKADDAEAVAAYVDSLGSLLSEPPRRLFSRGGLRAAIDRCVRSFPKGTAIGNALQPDAVEIAAAPRAHGNQTALVRSSARTHTATE